jgi:hypothetical protein
MAKENDMNLLYREVQHFRQVWLWILLLSLAGLAIYGMVQQLILGKPFGDNPASDTVLVIIVVVFGFGFPVFFYMINLTTEVRSDGLYIRFFPLHLSFRRIPLEDLKAYEARTYSALREYGGWGIRWGWGGKAYNVRGNRGVQVELSNGERILIGSQRAEQLAEALDLAMRRKSENRN